MIESADPETLSYVEDFVSLVNFGLALPIGSKRAKMFYTIPILSKSNAYFHYLNAGTGYPWAGQRTVMAWPIFAKAPNELNEELNVGFALPTGSKKAKQAFVGKIIS